MYLRGIRDVDDAGRWEGLICSWSGVYRVVDCASVGAWEAAALRALSVGGELGDVFRVFG